jgi:hypothetical protein
MASEHERLHQQLEERITKLENEKGLIRSGLGRMLSKFQGMLLKNDNSIADHENRIAELEKRNAEVDTHKPDTGDLAKKHEHQKVLRVIELVSESFNRAEIRELCFDFNIEYDDLPGESRGERVLELVTYFQRRNTLDVFIEWCAKLRPKIQWPQTELINVGLVPGSKEE